MSEAYLVPSSDAEAELVKKKSRFIAHIFRVEDEGEALVYLKMMRETYWDATHNVYAYILHDGTMRYSDDGEPGGTAGMPVLDVLRREGISQVLCVVTRYFGGTLLGTGGLVRAYGHSAKLGLEAAGISRRCVWRSVTTECPYSLYEQLRREISSCGGAVTDTLFESNVTIESIFPEEQTERFLKRVTEISAGRLSPLCGDAQLRDFPVSAADT